MNSKEINRGNLIISECVMPTGYKGYYWSNKENTLRYSYATMFKADLDNCKLFEEGIKVDNLYVLI